MPITASLQALQKRSHPGRWIRSLPFWLIVGLGLVLLVLVMAQRSLMQLDIAQASERAQQRLGAFETSLSASIDRHLYLPHILANDPRIVAALAQRDPQQPAVDNPVETSVLLRTIKRQAGADEIFLMDPAGMTQWSSNFETEFSFVGSNYAFRPYFSDAISGRPGFYFAVGATSGIPGLFLSAPVRDSDATVLGVIVVKINLQPLEQSWHASGDKVWVTDQEGIVFLSSNPRWHYVATRPLSEVHQDQLSRTRQFGQSPLTQLQPVTEWQSGRWSTFALDTEGTSLVFASDIDDYPWQMHLREPLAEAQARVRARQSLVLIGYASLAGALLYYRERRRRTDAQRAISRLTAEREHHQRAIIQNTDAGLLNLDEAFRPLFINEQARRLFALSENDLSHRPGQLLSPWQPGRYGQSSVRAEGLRTDGSRFPVLYTLNPIRVGTAREYIVTVQDITELTATQGALEEANTALEQRVEERTRDLQQAQAALAQNQKLAALGRMSSAIAHELNQPITALSNYAASSHLLLQRGKLEAVGTNLGKIEDLVTRLSNLSRQLRIFSGKRNTGATPVSLDGPIRYALELLKPRLDAADIDCQLDIRSGHLVQANTMMLEQIIVNLISNAIDALSGAEQRRIVITLEQTSASTPQSDDDAELKLSIRDTGPGIPADKLVHIFEPFYTTKAVGDGMGLGLAISYNLASDLGAHLTVDSDAGRGTVFYLTFAHSISPAVMQSEATK
jgi:PAS domain S-box-containing protein